MTRALEEIRRIMPPPERPSETAGSWDDVETRLGASLPDDYKEFVTAYGSGNIGEMPVTVHNPFSREPSINLFHAFEGIAGAYSRLENGGYALKYSLFPKPGGLLSWGTTGNGDYLHWRTLGPPTNWRVVVWLCGETLS
jgi:hypothetical protein